MFDATSQSRETAKGVKMTAAQDVLEMAFRQLLRETGIPEEAGNFGEWEEGEAERWLLKIANEGWHLDSVWVPGKGQFFPALG